MTARSSAPIINADHLSSKTDGKATVSGGRTNEALLDSVLRVAGIAVLEFWDDSFELISIQTGDDAEQPFGLSTQQTAEGTVWLDNVYPTDRDALQTYLDAEGAKTTECVDYRIIVGEGELLWVRHWILDRSEPEDGHRRIRSLLMPIPQQKHLEWECLRVSERECNRVGQELHDDLCQVLAGLTFMMRVVGQQARKVDMVLAAQIDEFNSHLVSATDRVRSMAHGLFPAQLKYATVRHALSAFAEEARTLFKVEIDLTFPRVLPRHTPAMIVHVYRVAQEAVSNAVRHGEATKIIIAVDGTPRGVLVRIADNGRGLPEESHRPEGIGMHVMEYRAHALGGTITLDKAQPHGAIVTLAYPAADVVNQDTFST